MTKKIAIEINRRVFLSAAVIVGLFLFFMVEDVAMAQWGSGKTIDELLEDLDALNLEAVSVERETKAKKEEVDSDRQYYDSKMAAWTANEIVLISSNNLRERLDVEGENHSERQREILAERDELMRQCVEAGFSAERNGDDEYVCIIECDDDDDNDNCIHRGVIMTNLISDYERRTGDYRQTFGEFLGRLGSWREDNQRLTSNQGTFEMQINIARSNYGVVSADLDGLRGNLESINDERRAIIRKLNVKNVLVPVEDFATSISECSQMARTEEILHCLQGYYDGNFRALPLLDVPEFD